MPIVAVILGLAAIAWGAVLARRTSLLVGVGAFVVINYALGHEFWHAKIGPLPITADRLVLLALCGAMGLHWWLGNISLRRMTGADWALVVLVAFLATSTVFSGQPDITDGVTSKWGRLVTSFFMPALLYVIVRQLPVTRRDWSILLAMFSVLGVYLALTGACEVAGHWSFVFPRYIANPDLGIHFGRARGPELNSVSLGIYLTFCATCAWLLLPHAHERWQQMALAIAVPLVAIGVLLTYTRSTWIGLAASGLVVAAFQIPRQWRVPAAVCGVVAGALVACIGWGSLLGIQREGTVEDAEHSVDQRASFAYVSWQMFCDHPVLGVGFGRFYDQKLSYLSDRRQTVELESIRGLHHHNTLLSFLTETGMVGLCAFAALLVAWGRQAWRLATATIAQPWVRAHGVLTLALIAIYLCSAVFHDLTLLPSQELLLFIMAGLTVNLFHAQIPTVAGISTGGRETYHRLTLFPITTAQRS